MEQDYFISFMSEVLKDLKKTKETFVFSEEQVNYIKSLPKYKDIVVVFDDGIYYLSIKEEVKV